MHSYFLYELRRLCDNSSQFSICLLNLVVHLMCCFRNFDFLIPDAPELIANFLEGEQDMSCKRNAFIMLIHADQV